MFFLKIIDGQDEELELLSTDTARLCRRHCNGGRGQPITHDYLRPPRSTADQAQATSTRLLEAVLQRALAAA
jgi:hypothetical protein